MSKILDLFRGSNDDGTTDAIRRTATETMAHLLERNRKFEMFLEEKLVNLERRSSPKGVSGEPSVVPDDQFLDFYEAATQPEAEPPEEGGAEPLMRARAFGETVATPPVVVPPLRTDDNDDDHSPTLPAGDDETVAITPPETVPEWQAMFGLDGDGDDDLSLTELSENSLPADDGRKGEFD